MRAGPMFVFCLALLLSGCTSESAQDDDVASDDDTDTDDDTTGDDDTFVPVDADGDGWDETVDCDDGDPDVHPDAAEACNGLDDDCDELIPADEVDLDGDGYLACEECNDDEPTLNNDDLDGDGVSTCDGDCDDANDAAYPGASEVCDGVDNDCDGGDPVGEADADGDGYRICGGDCDDGDAAVNPGQAELVCNGADDDCDATTLDEPDADGDGSTVCEGCDDGDPALEAQDVDGDGWSTCDGDCDDGDPALNLDDVDQDGASTCGGDCDDSDPLTYLGAPEVCDGLDNDCDGVPGVAEVDSDGDGVMSCGGDCDDGDAISFPGAAELCDGLDNDCDGSVPLDEYDGNGDGYQDCDVPVPTVTSLDPSADGRAVVGEWVHLLGVGFRANNLPTVSFGGTPAAVSPQFIDAGDLLVQVPPASPSGDQSVDIDFPQNDGGDTSMATWITRWVVVADPLLGKVYFFEFGNGVELTAFGQDIDVDDATVVAITPDGATAIVGDGRDAANAQPTLTFIDLTSDAAPAALGTIDSHGAGYLVDLAVQNEVVVVADADGLNVFDISVPVSPVYVGHYAYPAPDLAVTDVELTPDGELTAVLASGDSSLRFYDIDPVAGATLLPDVVAVSEGAQDLRLSSDGLVAYVLSGGGEGAIPPDLELGAACITVVDLASSPPSNLFGAGACVDVYDEAPLPADFAVAQDSTLYLSLHGEDFPSVSQAFEFVFDDPLDISAWSDFADTLVTSSMGAVVALDDVGSGTVTDSGRVDVADALQGNLAVRFDEAVFVSTVVLLDVIYDLENILDPYLGISADRAITIVDPASWTYEEFVLSNHTIVYYENFSLAYDLAPIQDLLSAPHTSMDVAIQP